MSSCDQWQSIQRAVDGEASPAARVLAAQHVRQCQACRTVLRSTLRIRRAIRSIPLMPVDPALSRRIQAALMLQRARLLQTWLRRSTAIAATILVGCTLLSLRGGATNGNEATDPIIVATDLDPADATPQAVAQWIVQDLSR